jgi:hypothetical protein
MFKLVRYSVGTEGAPVITSIPMASESFELLIRQLIASHREGEYWDFKAQPHTNKARLLHDLLCLANARHAGPRYLILGVEDPAQGTTVRGLQLNEPGRKTQANYLDFLRAQAFAGGIRPELELQQLTLDGKELDVLVVADNPEKPYFLLEDYRDQAVVVRGNYVYTRVGDTNTALDKSADLPQLERMWRQRFGLDVAPAQRLRQLLRQPQHWEKDLGNTRRAYHQHFPEYRLKLSTPKPLQEPYSYYFSNKKSYWGQAAFRYHTTTLLALDYVYLDEMRLLLPAPDTQHVDFTDQMRWFYYYDLDSAAGSFWTFLTADRSALTSRGTAPPFLLFRDRAERQAFITYLLAYETQLAKIEPGLAAEQAERRMQQDNFDLVIRPLDLGRIQVLYNQWRASKPLW